MQNQLLHSKLKQCIEPFEVYKARRLTDLVTFISKKKNWSFEKSEDFIIHQLDVVNTLYPDIPETLIMFINRDKGEVTEEALCYVEERMIHLAHTLFCMLGITELEAATYFSDAELVLFPKISTFRISRNG